MIQHCFFCHKPKTLEGSFGYLGDWHDLICSCTELNNQQPQIIFIKEIPSKELEHSAVCDLCNHQFTYKSQTSLQKVKCPNCNNITQI